MHASLDMDLFGTESQSATTSSLGSQKEKGSRLWRSGNRLVFNCMEPPHSTFDIRWVSNKRTIHCSKVISKLSLVRTAPPLNGGQKSCCLSHLCTPASTPCPVPSIMLAGSLRSSLPSLVQTFDASLGDCEDLGDLANAILDFE